MGVKMGVHRPLAPPKYLQMYVMELSFLLAVTLKHLLIIPCTLQLYKNWRESLLQAPGNELLQV